MESITVISEGSVYELDSYGRYHFVCFEEDLEKGPSLRHKRIMLMKASTVKEVFRVFVETNTDLWEHVGNVVISDSDMPTKLHLKYGDIPIEKGSHLYMALKETLNKTRTLAEEICKAHNPIQAYW